MSSISAPPASSSSSGLPAGGIATQHLAKDATNTPVWTNAITATSGTIDGTTIGATTPANVSATNFQGNKLLLNRGGSSIFPTEISALNSFPGLTSSIIRVPAGNATLDVNPLTAPGTSARMFTHFVEASAFGNFTTQSQTGGTLIQSAGASSTLSPGILTLLNTGTLNSGTAIRSGLVRLKIDSFNSPQGSAQDIFTCRLGINHVPSGIGSCQATVRMGFVSTVFGQPDGAYFECTYSDANNASVCQYVCRRSATLQTVVTTPVAGLSSTYQNFMIRINSSSAAEFYVNDILKTTISTNVPTFGGFGGTLFAATTMQTTTASLVPTSLALELDWLGFGLSQQVGAV